MVFCNIGNLKIGDDTLIVTILILIDGFLQFKKALANTDITSIVTILILIDGFLQSKTYINNIKEIEVTILILIDGFLQ